MARPVEKHWRLLGRDLRRVLRVIALPPLQQDAERQSFKLDSSVADVDKTGVQVLQDQSLLVVSLQGVKEDICNLA